MRSAARYALCLTTLLAASAVHAQTAAKVPRPHRSGFWLEIGGGPASARVACGGCADVTRNAGGSSIFRLGFPVSDRVLLGFDAFSFNNKKFGFAGNDDQSEARTGITTLVVLWYPWRSGLFIQAGSGAASSDFIVRPEGADSILVRGTGVGLTVGLGYDLHLSRRFAFTTNAGIHVAAIGDIDLPSAKVDDVIATIYHINIGLTLR